VLALFTTNVKTRVGLQFPNQGETKFEICFVKEHFLAIKSKVFFRFFARHLRTLPTLIDLGITVCFHDISHRVFWGSMSEAQKTLVLYEPLKCFGHVEQLSN